MTGYGEGVATHELGRITVTLRTLNSKGFELNSLPLPPRYKKLEIEVRTHLQAALKRGRVECTFAVEWNESLVPATLALNHSMVLQLAWQLKELQNVSIQRGDSELLGQGMINNCLPTLLARSEVWETKETPVSDGESQAVLRAFDLATDNLIDFRLAEGKATERDLLEQLKAIEDLRLEVDAMKDDRIDNVKARIQQGLEALQAEHNVAVDPQRFAQEMIFYIEKYDINEELKRLEQHCRYFRETLNDEESAGKKLNFITQEMGREINTIGSKANDYAMQRCVVQMKDHLERIKEQTLNVL